MSAALPPQAHGGQRLLGCLTKLKAVGVAVVVSRVYGGQHLGKARSIGQGCGEPSSTQPSSTQPSSTLCRQARFEHICTAARELLEALGHRPGAGIHYEWGGGQALGGSPAPVAAAAPHGAPAPAPGGQRKRKGVDTEAAEAQAATAKRAMLALAAERRLSGGGGAPGSSSSGKQ